MKDSTLLKISIISSVVGLIALYFILQIVGYSLTKITDIDETYIGKTVKVEGKVDYFSEKNGNTFLKIEGMNVVGFSMKINGLEKGKTIEVIGQVDEYEGELEILAKEILIK